MALIIACALYAGVASAQDSDLDDEMSSIDISSAPESGTTDSDNAIDTEIGPGD